MPRFLEQGLKGIFRSRWGVGVVIVVLVLAVVVVGRVFAGSNHDSPVSSAASTEPAITADPSDDDGVLSSEAPPAPITSPGRAQPEAVAYAFASAWVDHKNVSAKAWHDGLVPNATKHLSDQLNGVNPIGVPASRVLGRPGLVPVNSTLVNAVVNVDSGKLTLRLVSPDGHWLVDGIDWDGS